MRVAIALELGRVSNLPTVWTNVLAGVALAGSRPSLEAAALLCLATSLFYVGGMYLNDAFDWKIDASERPSRPIPSGRARVAEVFAYGVAFLVSALMLATAVATTFGRGSVQSTFALALLLGIAIVGYDAVHKRTRWAVLLMAACRALVYALAGSAVSSGAPGVPAWIAMLAIGCYVTGLTAIAAQETQARVRRPWPLLLLAAPLPAAVTLGGSSALVAVTGGAFLAYVGYVAFGLLRASAAIPLAVSRLIAAICLVDAMWLAACGLAAPAGIAAVGLPLTRALQRRIAGT